MTLNQLRTFLAVAERGSVRAAAEQLVVTQAAVSASLGALQRSLGVQLTRPDGRGLRLTDAGQAYVGYVRRILGLLDEAGRAAASAADPERGELRIAAVTTAAEQLVPGLLRGFRRDHPRTGVLLEAGNRDRVRDLLDRHQVDLVVGGRPEPGRDVQVHAVRTHLLSVVAAPDLAAGAAAAAAGAAAAASGGTRLAAGGDAGVAAGGGAGAATSGGAGAATGGGARAAASGDAGPAEAAGLVAWLASQTWLLREPGSSTRSSTETLLAELDIAPLTLTVGSNGAIRESASLGLGVTLMSRDAVAQELAAGRLAELPVPGTPLRRDWYLIGHPGPLPPPAARLVAHVLSEGNFRPPTPPVLPTPPAATGGRP